MTTLTLTPAVELAIEGALADADHEEACGLLLGRDRGPGGLLAAELAVCTNAAVLPSASFVIGRAELEQVIVHAQVAGLELLGSWHSHPRGSAYPSRRDLDSAIDPEWLLAISAAEGLRVWRGSAPEELEVRRLGAVTRYPAAS